MKKEVISTLLACMIFLCACTESDICSGDRIRAETLDDFGCRNSANTALILTSTEFSLVRNQSDYETVVKTICNPVIDWTVYDLIAGNLESAYVVTDIRSFVTLDCTTNTLLVDIEVRTSDVLEPSEVAFTVFFPKLENDQELFVQFE